MKVVILAGGLGTRIAEETDTKPKPMVLLDDKPIIWHLMNTFATQGFNEFVIATGYLGNIIHEWVSGLNSPWEIKVNDTGLNTQTGGRVKKCMELFPGERILVTYGDGLGNIDINSLISFHEKHNKLATVTAVRPPPRFGYVDIVGDQVKHFGEKNQSDAGWINGGFFVLESEVFQFIHSLEEPFETGALSRLTNKEQLMGYRHEGFWQPMDTLRERNDLSLMALERIPPWLRGLSG